MSLKNIKENISNTFAWKNIRTMTVITSYDDTVRYINHQH